MSDPTAGQPRYWWFAGTTVEQLTDQLIDAGPSARLEVHPKGNELFLVVVSTTDDDDVREEKRLQPLNESHPCPPAC